MTESSTTTTPTASAESPILDDHPLPRVQLRECEPWCEQGDGHPADHPVDRRCYAGIDRVAMSRHEPIDWALDEGWVSAHTAVELRRDSDAPTGRVLLNFVAGGGRDEEVDQWLEFTLEEAERLKMALDAALSAVRNA